MTSLSRQTIAEQIASPRAHTKLLETEKFPPEGRVSLTIHDSVKPSTSYGYQPNILLVYGKANGDRHLLACPALVGDIVTVDDQVEGITAYYGWPA